MAHPQATHSHTTKQNCPPGGALETSFPATAECRHTTHHLHASTMILHWPDKHWPGQPQSHAVTKEKVKDVDAPAITNTSCVQEHPPPPPPPPPVPLHNNHVHLSPPAQNPADGSGTNSFIGTSLSTQSSMFEVDWSTQVQQPKYHYHVPSPWTQQPHTTKSTAEHFWAVPPELISFTRLAMMSKLSSSFSNWHKMLLLQVSPYLYLSTFID